MEDWALIRHLYLAEGLSQRRIAEKLSLSRNTVARAVASSTPPRNERAPATNAFDAVEQKVRTLLKEYPRMPATVIAERVGWQGSISWFRENIQRLRPEYAPKDPAEVITLKGLSYRLRNSGIETLPSVRIEDRSE